MARIEINDIGIEYEVIGAEARSASTRTTRVRRPRPWLPGSRERGSSSAVFTSAAELTLKRLPVVAGA
jgi:hypothetical protein